MDDTTLFHYRARCVRVVDGDTADLVVDVGFHQTATLRLRLLGVDTPEMHAKDPAERERAVLARQYLIQALKPGLALPQDWPLRIRTEKSDAFGRWLADIWLADSGVSVNGELLKLGHAVEFKR